MLIKQWIDDFLTQQQLSENVLKGQASPSYQYHVTAAKFDGLQKELGLAKQFAILLGLQNKTVKQWDVDFVLYSAKWWQKNYQQGYWQKNNVFACFDTEKLSQQHLVIEKSLTFWQRKSYHIDAETRYLDNMVNEVGLPLQQLINSRLNSDWLINLFKIAIPKAIDSSINTIDFIKESQDYLPKSYRNEGVYSVLAQMISGVTSLNSQHLLPQQEPLVYLDNHVKNWREQFPLPLNNEVSSKLLSAMLTIVVNCPQQSLAPINDLSGEVILDLSDLASVLKVEPPALRQLLIQKIIRQMSVDFKHSAWQYLFDLQNTESPLKDFDFWYHAVENKKMLVALLVFMKPAIIQKLIEEFVIFWELITLAEWVVIFQQYWLHLQQQAKDEAVIKQLVENKIEQLTYLPASIEMIKRLLKNWFCSVADVDLSLMRTTDALTLFVIPQLNEAKKLLEQKQTDKKNFSLLSDELNEYWQNLDPIPSFLDEKNSLEEQSPVLLLPILLANFCLKEMPKNWLVTDYFFQLKQLKAFDEDWFNSAYQLSLAYLSHQPSNITQLIKDINAMINDNNDEILLLDQEIEDQIKELEVQTTELKTHANALEAEIGTSSSLSEELALLKIENEELKQRLTMMESGHDDFVSVFKEVMQKRDKALKYLLEEVTGLNEKMKNIRGLLDNKG